jgi:hypothetical protein
MERDDLIAKKFTVIHEVIKELELAVGMVFESDVEPELIPRAGLKIGELPSHNPKGENGKLKKFYALRIMDTFDFFTPLQREIYGELIFRKVNNVYILFGRNMEKKPFTFSKGRNHINLRIYRNGGTPQKNWYFNPLFIRIEDKEQICLVKLDINWTGNTVRLHFREPDNPPPFLHANEPLI